MHCVTLVLLSPLIVVSIRLFFVSASFSLSLTHTLMLYVHAILCKWFVSARLFAYRMHGNQQPEESIGYTHTKCHVSRWNAINAIAFRAIFTDYPNRNEWICIAAHAQTHAPANVCVVVWWLAKCIFASVFYHLHTRKRTHTHSCTQWDMTFSSICFVSIFNNTECDCNACLQNMNA